MIKQDAVQIAECFRNCGWDVQAREAPITRIGWELQGCPVNGGKNLFGFTYQDMKALVDSGRVATLPRSRGR